MRKFETKYGYFDAELDEYVITRPDTPRPWVNVICPGDYGLVISQTGGGYSWRTHASLNRLTRWDQDIIRDDWGKYIYLRDEDSGEIWSATWKPVCYTPESYEVRHGIGYSKFTSRHAGIRSELTVFVPKDEPVEVWQVRLVNESDRARRLSLFTYFEWLLGAAPDWHREFHKTFIETWYEPEAGPAAGALFATKFLWELPNRKGQHWNRDWEYYAFHSVSEAPAGYEGDKEAFLGMYGSLRAPKAVQEGKLSETTGRWGDAIASLHNRVSLRTGETRTLVYVLGAVEREARERAYELIRQYQQAGAADRALATVKEFWQELLGRIEVETPDEGFNLLTDVWLKYQAISGRLWGRSAYYQTGGAFGFRDQLQDSQVFLPIDPEKTRAQIRLHATHQFKAGNVMHWWQPILEHGAVNKISDNRLWLPFVTVNYLRETGDWAFLDEDIPFRDEGSGSLYEHCQAAIDYSLERRSERGLPLIGDGDWNDGMNAVGTEMKGESIWLGHFLCGVLRDFARVARRKGEAATAERYEQEAAALKAAINEHGWDGSWYLRATTDDGTPVGSATSKYARIFLNAQTWAIINDTAEGERRQAVVAAVKEYLAREYGPILFWPGYGEPDEKIGYLSRYAPGTRENGGLYTHAGTWAIWAAVRAGDPEFAWRLYRSFCPVYRGLNPDLYKVEPYVTPGNVAGPDSPLFGQGGWTWYTGSAAWLFRISTEWLLGIRPELGDGPETGASVKAGAEAGARAEAEAAASQRQGKGQGDGLVIDPYIPGDWDGFRVRRSFRGATYLIEVSNSEHVSCGVKRVTVDGQPLESLGGRLGAGQGTGCLIPVFGDGKEHVVEVVLGR